MNNKELINAGHELAKAISNDTPLIEIAKMVSNLATQLDVQTARADVLAKDNAKAMLVLKQADEAVKLARSKLIGLVAENAGLKAAFDKPQAYLSWHAIPPTWEDPLPCGEYLDVHDDAGHKNSDGTDCWPVYAKPEIETPATDAFLAEVRASAIDSLVDIKTKQLADMHPDTHAFGATSMSIRSQINELQVFADQLRKGVQS